MGKVCKTPSTSLSSCKVVPGFDIFLQYLRLGPDAEERKFALGKSGIFAGRMFQVESLMCISRLSHMLLVTAIPEIRSLRSRGRLATVGSERDRV